MLDRGLNVFFIFRVVSKKISCLEIFFLLSGKEIHERLVGREWKWRMGDCGSDTDGWMGCVRAAIYRFKSKLGYLVGWFLSDGMVFASILTPYGCI